MSTESQTQLDQLKNKLAKKEREMHSIQQIGKALSSVLNRDKLLVLIMDEVTRLINAERGTLYIVDIEKGELISVRSSPLARWNISNEPSGILTIN